MCTPICHAALFMHPLFRAATKHLPEKAFNQLIRKPLLKLLQQIGKGSMDNIHQFNLQCARYRQNLSPYNAPFFQSNGLSNWWSSLNQEQDQGNARNFIRMGIRLASILPHAADVERLFSLLGLFNTPLRASISIQGLESSAKVRMFYKDRTRYGFLITFTFQLACGLHHASVTLGHLCRPCTFVKMKHACTKHCK